MVRYGRQMVSVDVDNGVLLFDRKTGSFGIETITHDRSKFACITAELINFDIVQSQTILYYTTIIYYKQSIL